MTEPSPKLNRNEKGSNWSSFAPRFLDEMGIKYEAAAQALRQESHVEFVHPTLLQKAPSESSASPARDNKGRFTKSASPVEGAEEDFYRLQYEEECKSVIKDRIQYDKNIRKLKPEIMQAMSPQSQDKVRLHKSFKDDMDTIELWAIVKEIHMLRPGSCQVGAPSEERSKLSSMRMSATEKLDDFIKRHGDQRQRSILAGEESPENHVATDLIVQFNADFLHFQRTMLSMEKPPAKINEVYDLARAFNDRTAYLTDLHAKPKPRVEERVHFTPQGKYSSRSHSRPHRDARSPSPKPKDDRRSSSAQSYNHERPSRTTRDTRRYKDRERARDTAPRRDHKRDPSPHYKRDTSPPTGRRGHQDREHSYTNKKPCSQCHKKHPHGECSAKAFADHRKSRVHAVIAADEELSDRDVDDEDAYQSDYAYASISGFASDPSGYDSDSGSISSDSDHSDSDIASSTAHVTDSDSSDGPPSLLTSDFSDCGDNDTVYSTTDSDYSDDSLCLNALDTDDDDVDSNANRNLPQLHRRAAAANSAAHVADILKDPHTVILDTGATNSLFNTRTLLTNVRPSRAITFNSAAKGERIQADSIGDLCCELAGIGQATYCSTASANLLSFSALRRANIPVTYNSYEDVFTVECPAAGPVHFRQLHGLYIARICTPMHHSTLASFQVVDGQSEANYTKQQVERAREALQLHDRLDHPGDDALGRLLDSGGIVDCATTRADLRRARVLYGKCSPCMQGKMTASDEPRSVYDAPELTASELHWDLMFLPGIANKTVPYLLGVSMPGNYTTVTKLPSKTQAAVEKGMLQQIAKIQSFRHSPTVAHSDQEAVFTSTRTFLGTQGIQLFQCAPGQHDKVAERKIRTVKERCRANLAALKSKERLNLPVSLYDSLVKSTVSSINMTPDSTNKSDARTPFERITGIKPNAKTQFRCSFGEPIQCWTPNKSKTASEHLTEKTEFGIAVGRDTYSTRGSIKVFIPSTRETVTRSKFERIPMPAEVLRLINNIADEDSKDAKLSPPPFDITTDAPVRRGATAEPTPTPLSAPAQAQQQPSLTTPPVQSTIATIDQSRPLVNLPQGSPQSLQPPPTQQPTASSTFDSVAQIMPTSTKPFWTQILPPPTKPWPRGIEPTMVTRSRAAEQQAQLPHQSFIADHNALRGAFAISLRKALDTEPDKALPPIIKEMTQQIDKGVLEPRRPTSLTADQIAAAIPSKAFIKPKMDENGKIKAFKARFVGGGHKQDRALYPENGSPTPAPSSIMSVVTIAAYEHRHLVTFDVPGAFLTVDMEGPDVFVKLDSTLAGILAELYPQYANCLFPNGTMIVRAAKALYGTLPANKLWYKAFDKCLCSLGFVPNPADPCVYNLESTTDHQCTIAVHVDDGLMTCLSEPILERILVALDKQYPGLTIRRGREHQFLGMRIITDLNGTISVDQEVYAQKLCTAYGATGSAVDPARQDLFSISQESPALDKIGMSQFRSRVMAVLFLATHTRFDCLLATSFLATRIVAASKQDLAKLDHLLRYINGTKSLPLIFCPKDLEIVCYADASYSVHDDAKSRTGFVITLGGSTVLAKSEKQKIVSKSSTEAELIALNSSTDATLQQRRFMTGQGYVVGPTTTMQDNKSTMIMVQKGPGATKRSKHINVRYFYIKERVDAGDIVLEYVPTADMIADALTKALHGTLFRRLRALLQGNQE